MQAKCSFVKICTFIVCHQLVIKDFDLCRLCCVRAGPFLRRAGSQERVVASVLHGPLSLTHRLLSLPLDYNAQFCFVSAKKGNFIFVSLLPFLSCKFTSFSVVIHLNLNRKLGLIYNGYIMVTCCFT